MSSVSPTPTNSSPEQSALLFEIAWEVCNQVGGIYTVIKTKVPAMKERWGDNYILIGPYNPNHAAIEFEAIEPDETIRPTLAKLEAMGIACHYGRWIVEGKPRCILLDFLPRYAKLGEDQYFLFKDHGIPSDAADTEVKDAIAFGFTVFEFFSEFVKHNPNRKIVAQFHEWQAAVTIPRLRHLHVPVSTVFTTHATLLGRYIASDNPNFYRDLDYIDPYGAARHYNIFPRYMIERIAAQSAHVFTTISEVTAREAHKFLGREADFIVPNGLNVQRFTALHEFQNLHLKYKERIHEFVMGHFFPSYSFELDKTLYLFTSGRYEYRNKGMDIFIEALYRLNLRLKEHANPITVVAFVITRAATKNINVSVLQNQLMFEDLKNACLELETGLASKLLSSCARGRLPGYEDMVTNDFQVRFKRIMHARKSNRLPSIVTHDMWDDAGDPVLRHLRHRNLFNDPSDPVKVVFHPDFVTATSPLFNLDYDQFVRGCHMGVFPSYYEPWGYTPLECIALGLPAVTTDLSGFGAYVKRNVPAADVQGIYVLNRVERTPEQSIEDLTNYLYRFVQLTRRERIELRNRAERLTDKFDWSVLAVHYHRAHEEALKRL